MNRRFLVFILIILGALSLDAQNIIRPKVECPNGIYVNSYNGVLFYQRPDVSLNNRSLRLEAVFYYNSSSNRTNYGYGNGWSLGHELRFVNDSLGVIIEQGDGRRDLYTRYGSGFEAPAGVFSTLSVEGDGYLLTYKDGTKYYFTDTVHKQVTQLKDRYNNTLDFDYQNGRLSSITDISGRSLYFTWTDSLMTELHTSFDDRTWSYRYDDRGNLTCVTDPMGYSVYYGYNDDNRIKTFTDAEGYSTHISYNVDGMAHRVKTDLTDKSIRYELAKGQTIFIDYLKDAHNQYTKYIWDDKGRLVEIENVNMHTSTKFAYDDDNNLVRREDANGNAYTFTYDQNGNMLSTTDPLGNTEYYTYESTFNKVTSYTDKMGHLYTYQYDSHGDLLQMNGPLNYNLSFAYNEYGQATVVTDANGNPSYYDYDSYGNLVTQTDPLGNVTTIVYNAAGLPLTQTNPDGALLNLVYDKAEHVVEAIDALQYSVKIQYDRKGNIIRYTDALNNSFDLSYDAVGHLTSILNPLGAKKQFYYSGNRVVRFKDALDNMETYVYDDADRIVFSVNAENDTTRYVYDNAGNMIGKLLPNGNNISYQYDNLDRLIYASDNIGVLFTNQYDANSNLIVYEDGMGAKSYFYRDALNRIIQAKDALENSQYYVYDNAGNLINFQNKNGYSTIYTYDATNKVLSKTDAMNYVTSYSYDANGQLSSVIDANGNETTFEYDTQQQLNTITFPNGTTRHYWYDGNGNITMMEKQSGERMSYTYDALNRLTAMNCVGDPDEFRSYQFDLNGNMVSATNQNATSSFTYDRCGRMISETLNGNTTSYSYDSNNNSIDITYPCGQVFRRNYDARSRLISVMNNRSLLASYIYDNANNVTNCTYANGRSVNYEYDAMGFVSHMFDDDHKIDRIYINDPVGNPLGTVDFVNESFSNMNQYNPNNQLIEYSQGVWDDNNQIANPIQHIEYSYDALGNWISVNSDDHTYDYSYDVMNAINTILEDGQQAHVLDYDVNGNLLNDGVHSYQYDSFNSLISIDFGNTASYQYDALGRKTQEELLLEEMIKIEQYCYAFDQVIEGRDDGELQSLFALGLCLKDIIMEIAGPSTHYYTVDQSSSVVQVTDGNSNVLESYDYDPFGNVVIFDGYGNQISSSQIDNKIMYLGAIVDELVGAYQLDGRTYDPDYGCYYESDPLVYENSMNTYSADSNSGKKKNRKNKGIVKSFFTSIPPTVSDASSLVSALGEINGVPELMNDAGGSLTVLSAIFDGLNYVYDVVANDINNTSTIEDEYANHGEFAGSVLLGPILGTIGATGGAIKGAFKELYNQTIFGDSDGDVLDVFKAGFNQALEDAQKGNEYSRQIGRFFGRGLGSSVDGILDAREQQCAEFMQTGYENASKQQQRLYDRYHDAPTNEFYYMFGMRGIFTDECADRIYRFNNFVRNFTNRIFK